MKRFLAFALVTTASTWAHAQQPFPTNHIHIDGPPDVVLELDEGDGWRPICNAPCHVPIPFAQGYRLNGPDMQPSRTFALPPQARLTVQSTGSRGLHNLGMVLVPLGSAAIAASIALFLSTLGYLCSDCVEGLANTTTANWGWGTLAGGLAGLVTGVLLVTNERTKVTVWGEPLAWVRVRDPESTKARLDAAKATGMPIFAVSF
jgi:hypothetical protein